MALAENKIIELFLELSNCKKQLVSIAIGTAMIPLVYNLKCKELNSIYDKYLDDLWKLQPINATKKVEYEEKTDACFDYKEFDENSFISYQDPNFIKYLAYVGKESVRYSLEPNKNIYGRINILSFIKVNKILDDYSYRKNKSGINNSLVIILAQISKRELEDSSIDMLDNIIELLNCNSVFLEEEIKVHINLYHNKLKLVLN